MSGIDELARAFTRAASPRHSARYVEDPTVAETAADEASRLWQRISTKVQGGVWFYAARERVLAEEIPDIAKAFGRPVASRVERAVQQTQPRDLLPAASAAVRTGNQAAARAYLRERYGRVSLINRACLVLFGRHFW